MEQRPDETDEQFQARYAAALDEKRRQAIGATKLVGRDRYVINLLDLLLWLSVFCVIFYPVFALFGSSNGSGARSEVWWVNRLLDSLDSITSCLHFLAICAYFGVVFTVRYFATKD